MNMQNYLMSGPIEIYNLPTAKFGTSSCHGMYTLIFIRKHECRRCIEVSDP